MLLSSKSVHSLFSTIRGSVESGSSSERACNFELLRILGMFLIVWHHYGGEKSIQFDRGSENYLWINELFIRSMETTGKIGVSIFLLLTGYFQNGRAVKTSSIARTWFQTVCWSYILAGVWYMQGKNIYIRGAHIIFFPVLKRNYWFVSTYISVACFSGWIAAICRNATPAQYVTGLVTLFAIMSLFTWDNFVAFCNTQWFMFVIALGGFLRRFSRKLEWITMRMLVTALILVSAVVYGSIYMCLFHDFQWPYRHGGFNALVRENWCPASLFMGIILMMMTERTKKFTCPLINRISGLTLGVYLIHENCLIRTEVWAVMCHAVTYRDYVSMPVIAVLQVVTVYTVCSFLEFVRQIVLGRLETLVVDIAGRVGSSVGEKINSALDEPELEKV